MNEWAENPVLVQSVINLLDSLCFYFIASGLMNIVTPFLG